MKNIIILLFLIVTVFTGCKNDSPIYTRLEKVDRLLTKEENDSALECLMSIDANSIKAYKDRAYYFLLFTETLYRLQLPTYSDTAINASIKYYRQSNNKRNLARALYYKGMMASGRGDIKETIRYVKEAEIIAENVGTTSLLNYIYINLSTINSRVGNHNTALTYAKKSLEIAERQKDQSMICLSFEKISNAFAGIEQHDSALFYAKKAIPYIKHLSKEERATVLSNISASYFNQGQVAEAERYIKQSMAVEPTPYAYYILGSIYIEQGKSAEAAALWDKAMSTGSPEIRAEAMLWTADMKKEAGEYREAAELMAKAEALNDSISKRKETESALRLQALTERAEAERKAGNRLTAAIIIMLAIAAMLITLAIRLHKKMNMTKKQLSYIEELTGKYLQKINELNASKAENEKEINSLNRKIATLCEKRAAIIGHGRKRYEEIREGGTVAAWKKEDFEAAIEYCRTIMPETVNGIENSHKRLTPYNVFFLLLPHIGIADDDIPHAMNMTRGAARTMKYRLKDKGAN